MDAKKSEVKMLGDCQGYPAPLLRKQEHYPAGLCGCCGLEVSCKFLCDKVVSQGDEGL